MVTFPARWARVVMVAVAIVWAAYTARLHTLGPSEAEVEATLLADRELSGDMRLNRELFAQDKSLYDAHKPSDRDRSEDRDFYNRVMESMKGKAQREIDIRAQARELHFTNHWRMTADWLPCSRSSGRSPGISPRDRGAPAARGRRRPARRWTRTTRSAS